MEPHHASHVEMSPLLGSADVAELLGMSREQVWRLWTTGRLPGYRFDRHIRFSRDDLERFKAQHYRSTSSATTVPRASRSTQQSDYHPI